jgi:hypothetical protein
MMEKGVVLIDGILLVLHVIRPARGGLQNRQTIILHRHFVRQLVRDRCLAVWSSLGPPRLEKQNGRDTAAFMPLLQRSVCRSWLSSNAQQSPTALSLNPMGTLDCVSAPINPRCQHGVDGAADLVNMLIRSLKGGGYAEPNEPSS